MFYVYWVSFLSSLAGEWSETPICLIESRFSRGVFTYSIVVWVWNYLSIKMPKGEIVNSIFGILMWTKIPISFNSVLTCVIGIFRINEQIFWICGLMIKYLMLIVWINYPIFALNKSYFWNMRKCFYWRFLHKWDIWDFFFTKHKSKSIKGKWFSK